MSRTIIVSNRLPIKISNLDKSFEFSSTSGGLATGMKSIHKKNNFLWIGWPGIDKKSLGDNLNKAEKLLFKKNYIPVFLRKKEINDFYYGTSNEALWPLFHYFGRNCHSPGVPWLHLVFPLTCTLGLPTWC